MKNLVSILMIGLLLISCNKVAEKTDGYVINGTANGVYNGIRVYLSAPDERGTQIPQDTAIVMDGAFKFAGKVENPQMWFLSVDNVPGIIPFMIENVAIAIKFDKDNPVASTVTGTKSNKALNDYTQGYNALIIKREKLNTEFSEQANSLDSDARARLTEEFGKVNQELQEYPFDFLKDHKDNHFSLTLIDNILISNPVAFEDIDNAYSNLDDDVKNTPQGKIIGSKIEVIKKHNESFAMLNIGKEAPDFSAPNPEGKQLSLYEVRGKATIIDFWASWCGPCRRENPNVVNVFKKYHDKGLEIISVSLDRPEQKENWLKAIKDDKLTWHHVSNLEYFNDPVAKQYNIQSIPATFILDAEGKIVAKSLRGQALEDKISEMLD